MRNEGNTFKTLVDAVLQVFGDLLNVRLEKDVYTTEDSVRYTFFAALQSTAGLRPEDVVVEYPHPVISRALIDTYIPDFDGGTLAVEFKYDRQIPSGRNMPRPKKAGDALRDVGRLSQIECANDTQLLFVYLTDSEMATYLSSPTNGLNNFFSLEPRRALTVDGAYLAGRSETLRNTAGDVSASVLCLVSRSLAARHELRVYKVTALPDKR